MTIDDHVREAGAPWMTEDAPDQDVVISSRARLARNLRGLNFPERLSDRGGDALLNETEGAFSKLGPEWSFFRLRAVPEVDLQVLVEKHLISPELAQDTRFHGLALTQGEDESVMVHEEDHIRLQTFSPGLDLKGALAKARGIDEKLEGSLEWAFDGRLGYLTACPTNLGTGLRVSLMAHLPALVLTQEMRQLVPALTKIGIAVRGIYGEGTQALGEIFQISNQVTLGQSEDAIAEGVHHVGQQIVERERRARERIAGEHMTELQDRVFRALGTLQNARLLSAEEAIEKISTLRVGREMGLLKHPGYRTLEALMVMSLPGFLERTSGATLSRDERLRLRASLVRERLKTEKGDD